MTISAEILGFVALAAVGLLAGSFQTVGESEVQVMDVPLQVVSAMALQTTGFAAMARGTPRSFRLGSHTVLMPPAIGVDIGQCWAFAVAQTAGVVGRAAIMAIHAERFAGHKGFIDRLALIDTLVTTQAGQAAAEMKLVIEFYFIGFYISGGFLRIVMTRTAGRVILNIVAITAGAHVRQIIVGFAGTFFYSRVADIAGNLRLTDMKSMRKNYIALQPGRCGRFSGDGVPQCYNHQYCYDKKCNLPDNHIFPLLYLNENPLLRRR